jgi:WbqC-like protein
MTKVVISQPMFFPWGGLFEQIRLADVFVHYDDVALPQGGSFIRRVQIKTPDGVQWLTVPVLHGSQLIRDVQIDNAQDWRTKHLKTLQRVYAKAPHAAEMLSLVEQVYAQPISRLSDLNRCSIETVGAYLGFEPQFVVSSDLDTQSSSSQKLLDLMLQLGGTVYITGHGARNYLDHAIFDDRSIQVEYMDYRRAPYPQLYGPFDPHVTVLDMIANVGPHAADYLCSGTRPWKEFVGV